MSETSKPVCPRAIEDGRTDFIFPLSNKPDDGSCDYCGSLSGDVFMARVQAGDVTLGPTDKSYKVYVLNAGGQPFKRAHRIDSIEERMKAAAKNMKLPLDVRAALSPDVLDDVEKYEAGEPLDKMRNWKWVTEDRQEGKFYFQHLTVDQQKRFVDLLNEKKIKFGEPGYFYVRPFFISREGAA